MKSIYGHNSGGLNQGDVDSFSRAADEGNYLHLERIVVSSLKPARFEIKWGGTGFEELREVLFTGPGANVKVLEFSGISLDSGKTVKVEGKNLDSDVQELGMSIESVEDSNP